MVLSASLYDISVNMLCSNKANVILAHLPRHRKCSVTVIRPADILVEVCSENPELVPGNLGWHSCAKFPFSIS